MYERNNTLFVAIFLLLYDAMIRVTSRNDVCHVSLVFEP